MEFKTQSNNKTGTCSVATFSHVSSDKLSSPAKKYCKTCECTWFYT